MRSTKKSLLMSVLSLMLCVAMLLGTTFAWFTDSVTSGKNTIKAGNLDIEVEYSKDMAAGSWKTVEGATELFDDVTLWEPGAVSVVYLKIKNAGTLALKYQLGINIVSETVGINKEDKEFKLSDYIMFGQKDNVTAAYADRAAAVAAVSGAQKISSGYTTDGTMVADAAERIIALVVYMPETVGNEANYMTGTEIPTIEMGLNVVATQLQNEADSFGTDYDKDAAIELPVILPETKVAQHITKDGDNKLTEGVVIKDKVEDPTLQAVVPVGAKVKEGVNELQLVVTPKEKSTAEVTVAATDLLESVAYYDIKLEGLAEDNTEDIIVSVFVGKNLASVKAYHKGILISGSSYDPTTGMASFKVKDFSPFAFVVSDGKYHVDTAEQLKSITTSGKSYKGETIVLDNDIDLKGIEWKSMAGFAGTFDGQNHTISNLSIVDNTAEYAAFFSTFGGTVKNVTFDKAYVRGNRAAIVVEYTTGGPVVVENVKVTNSVVDGEQKNGGLIGFASGKQNGGCTNVTVKNCTVDGLTFKNDETGERAWQSGAVIGYVHPEQNLTVTGNTVKNVSIENDPAENYPDNCLYASHPFIGVLDITNSNGYTVNISNNTVGENCTGFAKGNYHTVYCGGQTTFDKNSARLIIDNVENFIVDKKVEVEANADSTTVKEKLTETIMSEEVKAGDVIELPKLDDAFKLPNIGKNVTIIGNGSTVNATGSGSIASVPNGATFVGMVFDFGSSSYHGFQHAGKIVFKNCTLNGLFFSYGDMEFDNCVFNAPSSEYSMWDYGQDVTYNNCVFNGSGKWINVYCEKNATAYNIEFNECKFVNTAEVANKAGINVKDTCGATQLKYNVVINKCTYEGVAPEASTSTGKIVFNPVVMVDDISGNPSDVTVTMDGKLLFPAA